MDLRNAILARLAQMKDPSGLKSKQEVLSGMPEDRSRSLAYGARKAASVSDPRGLTGQLSRGRNVYRGGSNAAHRGAGGPNMGRPQENAMQTRSKDAVLKQAAQRRLGG